MGRIFDHLDGEPEDVVFSRAARQLRKSAWWAQIPAYTEPPAVAGEIPTKETACTFSTS